MMTKIDWARKLSSRKFWSLLIALIAAGLVLMKVDENTIAQICATVGAFASVVIYILAEAYIDSKHAEQSVIEYINDDDGKEFEKGH
jgi:hypothetical protein